MKQWLLYLLAITVCFSICSCQNMNFEKPETKESVDFNIPDKTDNWYIRGNAPKNKVAITDNGTRENVSYTDTNGNKPENPNDIYEDEEQNQYRYNQDGDLVAYRAGLSETETNSTESSNETVSQFNIVENDTRTLTISDNIPIADQMILNSTWNYVCQAYGNRVNGFELLRCELRPGTAGYYVDFAKTYGVNGFITGPLIANALDLNGNLIYSTISNDLMTDFDASLVENLTQEQVYASVVPTYEEQNPDYAATPIEISSVKLIRQNNTFALQVVLKFQTAITNTELCEVKEVCYYSLDSLV
ncbi:MAG: hypothetical protein IJ407_02015 [Clostridia bacterium]|nr:hypothetical protein [Clostridia bacterium]